MDERNIVTVFEPETEWQGDLIVQELKQSGIDAYLANRSTANVWGQAAPLAALQILVPEGQADQATRLIDEFLTHHSIVLEEISDVDSPENPEATEPEEPQSPNEANP